MSALAYVRQTVIPAALSMLPPKMDSAEARAMLLAIGLQESRFEFRKQIEGPARGFFQFEQTGGVAGVLSHKATSQIIRDVLDSMMYDYSAGLSYQAIADNDILACIYARLLLWTLPQPLPAQNNPAGAWSQYLAAWRPGKPHRSTWDDFHEQAWESV